VQWAAELRGRLVELASQPFPPREDDVVVHVCIGNDDRREVRHERDDRRDEGGRNLA
jgi:hypothetical protein